MIDRLEFPLVNNKDTELKTGSREWSTHMVWVYRTINRFICSLYIKVTILITEQVIQLVVSLE